MFPILPEHELKVARLQQLPHNTIYPDSNKMSTYISCSPERWVFFYILYMFIYVYVCLCMFMYVYVCLFVFIFLYFTCKIRMTQTLNNIISCI
jgi:hypothetical protein